MVETPQPQTNYIAFSKSRKTVNLTSWNLAFLLVGRVCTSAEISCPFLALVEKYF